MYSAFLSFLSPVFCQRLFPSDGIAAGDGALWLPSV